MVDSVDVLVVGGTTGAVAAALSAAKRGRTVLLVTDRTYLGEDTCAHQRMWLHSGESAPDGLARRIFTADGPVRPLHVKHTLDRELESAGVRFLFSSFVSDVLRDGAGHPAGVVIANRTGRHAVGAKIIIDATDRAWVARMAGAAFTAYPSGPARFARVVIGGEPRGGAGIERARVLEFTIEGYPVVEYELVIDMPDGSWRSFARAEQVARDLTFHPDQVDDADTLFQVPPDVLAARAHHAGAFAGSAALDVGVSRPADVARVYALGGCAGVSREAAEALVRPVNLIAWGERIGEAAAAEAQSVAAPEGAGILAERGGGFRPTDPPAPELPPLPRDLPVLGEYDVVVIGGGTGGAPAGIAAARAGARTLVVEYQRGLGGVATMGLIGKYYYSNRVGFTAELDAAWPSQDDPHYIPRKMEWLRAENRTRGVDVWFGAIACGATVDGARVTGAIIATPEGRGVVRAHTVIDATGNADVAAGAECMYTGGEHVGVQGAGLPPRALGASYTNTDYTFADDTDVIDATHLFVWAREKLGGAYDLGQLLDTRERRRIVGDFVMTPMDIINERTYPDTIVASFSNFDSHGFSVHEYFFLNPPDEIGVRVDVPLRCLLPQGRDGILVTGLGVSAHRDAMPVIRMQPDIQNQGYAAGRLAAMAALRASSVRDVDVKDLQRHLVEVGILESRTLSDVDSYPVPATAVKAAVDSLGGGVGPAAESGGARLDFKHALAIVLAHTEVSLPLMREACRSRDAGSTRRLVYAHVLGMLGDATGADLLLENVSEAKAWDRGWNYVGMGQYGASVSTLDSLVTALARTRSPAALEPIVRLASLLDASQDFSHHRAVAIACETLARPEAARVLAEVLSKPGMSGHQVTNGSEARERYGADPCETEPRNKALRELVVARALYRCGDVDDFGTRTLERYADDVRGHFSRHARAVLAG